MSELEDQTESLQEKIHEEAEHERKEKWILWVALFTALVSVMAALTGMLSAHHENESLLARMKASDQWNYYQAKGIKAEIISSTIKITDAANTDTASVNKVKRYKKEQEDIKKSAEGFEMETEEHLDRHGRLARGVTLFQISIAISAISIITRRKLFWAIGIVFALSGCFFLAQGIM